MIVVSMVLVIIGAVTLVIGVFFADDDLTFVYISIASCLLAGLFLVIGIVRGRPSSKPVAAGGGQPQAAPTPSWSGSPQSSSWQASSPSAAAQQDEEEAPTAGRVQVVGQDEAQEETPQAAPAAAEDEDEDVTLMGEPAGETAPVPRTAGVPGKPGQKIPRKKSLGKKSLGKKAGGGRPLKKLTTPPPAAPAEEAPEPVAEPAPAAKKATKKAAAKKATKKAAAKKATKKAAKKATKKATVKKTAVKKATKKSAAKKAGGTGRTKRADFDAVMSDVTGVGPAKIDALFTHFGSIEVLRNASVDEIASTKGISGTLAKRIHDQLH